MLDGRFFRKVAPNVRDRYREHIFGKGKDVFGKGFKNYTTKYGQRKRANKFKRQASQYANSTAPVLTSDFLRDYGLVRMSSDGFQLGWTSFGARVKHLADKGRVVTSSKQPLPEPVIKYIMKEAKTYIGKHKLPKSKTTRYKIGK